MHLLVNWGSPRLSNWDEGRNCRASSDDLSSLISMISLQSWWILFHKPSEFTSARATAQDSVWLWCSFKVKIRFSTLKLCTQKAWKQLLGTVIGKEDDRNTNVTIKTTTDTYVHGHRAMQPHPPLESNPSSFRLGAVPTYPQSSSKIS